MIGAIAQGDSPTAVLAGLEKIRPHDFEASPYRAKYVTCRLLPLLGVEEEAPCHCQCEAQMTMPWVVPCQRRACERRALCDTC